MLGISYLISQNRSYLPLVRVSWCGYLDLMLGLKGIFAKAERQEILVAQQDRIWLALLLLKGCTTASVLRQNYAQQPIFLMKVLLARHQRQYQRTALWRLYDRTARGLVCIGSDSVYFGKTAGISATSKTTN